MKKPIALLLCILLLTGCSSTAAAPSPAPTAAPETPSQTFQAPEYTSRFDTVTEILLSDEGITIDDSTKSDVVFTSRDIIYYEDRDSYPSGNPYGEGTAADRHTSEEAAAHTVVNITAPGAYIVTGKLSAGQIRVDLGENASRDPNAVVELIKLDADITCTVAPAILFLNTYECDGNWSADTASAEVDTSAAGANLILRNSNTVSGSYVARIYKDKEGEKKLWKQDGAIYSYMSMNVYGPGSLELTAANEGLDTELHLTMNGGNVRIFSDNDGINTNEDGVSVTTINGGNLTIYAGLGAEGDGIDSNGYLVINGGTVVASANPGADAGLDSDLGSFIHGGTVVAFGSTMDWAESDSRQVTMNLQFASRQAAGSKISLTRQDGTELFSFESDTRHDRPFTGLILSHPALSQGETCHVWLDGVQMAYTGTDVRRGPGGFDGRPPEGFDPGQLPDGFDPGQIPGEFEAPEGFTPGSQPEGFDPSRPGAEQLPDGSISLPPEGFAPPDNQMPPMPQEGFGSGESSPDRNPGSPSVDFYLNDMVNCFSGIAPL